jgi:hypothetical protein
MMKQFKYKIVKSKESLSEGKLNEFGRHGYELCGVCYDEYSYTYHFKIETTVNG